MWSIVHDEGNITIDIDATYSQSGGPNITVNAPNHGLELIQTGILSFRAEPHYQRVHRISGTE